MKGQHDLNSTIGDQFKFLDNIPGSVKAELNFQFFVPTEDRVATFITSLSGQERNLPANLFSAPWIGYLSALDSVFTTFLGTGETHFLLNFNRTLNLGDNSKMKSGYIVFVVPNRGESNLAISADLSNRGDGKEMHIRQNGVDIKDHTYVVLKILKDTGFPSLKTAIDNNPNDEWAKFASENLVGTRFVARADQPSDKAKFDALVSTLLNEIYTERRYLQADRRLAANDIDFFINEIKKEENLVVNAKCFEKAVTGNNCPAPKLLQ